MVDDVHGGLFGGCRATVDTDVTSTSRQLSVHIFAKPLVRHDKSTCSCASNLTSLRKFRLQLSMAFLVLLEALSPVERAVSTLRKVFGYGYPDVARITGKTEVNCRHIFARASTSCSPVVPTPRKAARLEEGIVRGRLLARVGSNHVGRQGDPWDTRNA